jgi:hypothetical protein
MLVPLAEPLISAKCCKALCLMIIYGFHFMCFNLMLNMFDWVITLFQKIIVYH